MALEEENHIWEFLMQKFQHPQQLGSATHGDILMKEMGNGENQRKNLIKGKQ